MRAIGTFGNVPIGIFTAYLVITSLISVRPPDEDRARRLDMTLVVTVLAVALSLALVIASFSFFIGQARVIPKPIRIYPLLMVPPLIALAALFYWLWRVRIRQKMRGLQLKPVSAAPVLPRTVGGGVGVRVQGNQTIAG